MKSAAQDRVKLTDASELESALANLRLVRGAKLWQATLSGTETDALLNEIERLRAEKAGAEADSRRAWEAVRREGERSAEERKLYGEKFNAIAAALGHATEAQDKLAFGDVDAAMEEIGKVVSILVDA